MKLNFPKDVHQYIHSDGSAFSRGEKGTLFIGDRDPAEFLNAGFTLYEEPAIVTPAEPAPTTISTERAPELNMVVPQGYTTDAPVADAPVADAPVADAPVADAPVADAPASEQLDQLKGDSDE